MWLSSPFFFVKTGRFIQFEFGCFICSIGYYAGIVVIIVLIMGSVVWTNDVNHLESREQKLSISFKNAGNKSLAADCQNRKYEVLGQTLRISFNRANLKIALYVDQISSLMKWCISTLRNTDIWAAFLYFLTSRSLSSSSSSPLWPFFHKILLISFRAWYWGQTNNGTKIHVQCRSASVSSLLEYQM